jgi:ABC-type multidrug transport system ATPase subunit
MHEPAPVLQVRGLCFAHPQQDSLFADLSFALAPGVHRLQGDSGKTSLLRLLAGELRGAGELWLCGRRLDTDPAACRQAVCWFDARDQRFDALTPAGLMATLRERHAGLDEAAWRDHLAGFALGPHLDKPLYALSRGSRQKAALAVALSAGCALTLLDEPGAGLDRPSLDHLARALAGPVAGPGRAVLMVCSHELPALALAGTISLP